MATDRRVPASTCLFGGILAVDDVDLAVLVEVPGLTIRMVAVPQGVEGGGLPRAATPVDVPGEIDRSSGHEARTSHGERGIVEHPQDDFRSQLDAEAAAG